MSVLAIPDDILGQVSTCLSLTDLFNATAASKQWHSICDSNRAWQPRLSCALKIADVVQDTEANLPTEKSVQADAQSLEPPSIEFVAAALTRSRLSPRETGDISNICIRYISRSSSTAEFQFMQLLGFHRSQRQLFGEAVFKFDDGQWHLQRIRPMKPKDVTTILNAEPNVPPFKPIVETSPFLDSNNQSINDVSSRSAKLQYLRRFRCSGSHVTSCNRVMAPRPPLVPQPSPRVLNTLFLEGIANDLTFEQLQQLEPPASHYPPLSPLPLCRVCASVVATDFQAVVNAMCERAFTSRKQISCIVRVNRSMFDVRFQHYETDAEYRRFITFPQQLADSSQSNSQSSNQSSNQTSKQSIKQSSNQSSNQTINLDDPRRWNVAAVLENESGIYSIGVPSNIRYDNPAPPTIGIAACQMKWHHHELVHYALAPYHGHSFICNVCRHSSAREPLWHCSVCQFDCCLTCADQQS